MIFEDRLHLEQPLGKFQIIKSKEDGTITLDTGLLDNVVTDRFWYDIFNATSLQQHRASTSTIMPNCVISNSSVEVQKTDTALTSVVSGIARTSTLLFGSTAVYAIEEVGGKSYYKIGTRYTWALGALNNKTISKVGICASTTGTGMVAGQLIRDSSNTPVTITILADEQLDIYYYLYIPVMTVVADPTVYQVLVNGTSHNYTKNYNYTSIINPATSTLSFAVGGTSGSNAYALYINGERNVGGTNVPTVYANSKEYLTTSTIGITTNAYTPINTLYSAITNFTGGGSQNTLSYVTYNFPNSTLSKLATDSITLQTRTILTW